MIEKTHGVLRGEVIWRTDTGNTSGLWLSRKSVHGGLGWGLEEHCEQEPERGTVLASFCFVTVECCVRWLIVSLLSSEGHPGSLWRGSGA